MVKAQEKMGRLYFFLDLFLFIQKSGIIGTIENGFPNGMAENGLI